MSLALWWRGWSAFVIQAANGSYVRRAAIWLGIILSTGLPPQGIRYLNVLADQRTLDANSRMIRDQLDALSTRKKIMLAELKALPAPQSNEGPVWPQDDSVPKRLADGLIWLGTQVSRHGLETVELGSADAPCRFLSDLDQGSFIDLQVSTILLRVQGAHGDVLALVRALSSARAPTLLHSLTLSMAPSSDLMEAKAMIHLLPQFPVPSE